MSLLLASSNSSRKVPDNASSETFRIDGQNWSAEMRFASFSTIFRIAFRNYGVIDVLEMDGLSAGAGSGSVVGLNGASLVSDSREAFSISPSSSFALILGSSSRKEVMNDGLAGLPEMRLGSPITGPRSGIISCDHI